MHHHDTHNSNVAAITVIDYLMVIIRNKKQIVFPAIATAVITAAITLALPNSYTAKTLIIPTEDDKSGISPLMAQLGGLAGVAGAAMGTKTTGDLYVAMLKSETIKDPIIDRFKLLDVYDAKYRSDVYGSLNNLVAISLGKKDGIITIAVDDKDPKRAADIANSYVEELGRLAASLNTTGAGRNREFLEKRMAEARADLNRAENALKEFQSINKAVFVTEQARASLEGVAQLRGQLALKEVELGTLQRQFTDSSQEVKTAKSAIAYLKNQIAILEGNNNSKSSIPNMGAVPQLGQEYVKLMREFKIQEAVLEMLAKQYEVTKLSESKDIPPIQVLQKAKVPERKSKPKRSLIVVMAAIGAALAMTIVSFLREYKTWMTTEAQQSWEKLLNLRHPRGN